MLVDWKGLAQIKELKEYFETESSADFQNRIEYHIHELQKLDSEELDKLTFLRVLEVTNGCTQWGFRLKDEGCLSVEQTRECMREVMTTIRTKRIDLPSGKTIRFAPSTEELISEGIELYKTAFKKNDADAQKEYYAYSTAQFLVYGRQRLDAAMESVKREFEPLFTPHYIQKGRDYISKYYDLIHS